MITPIELNVIQYNELERRLAGYAFFRRFSDNGRIRYFIKPAIKPSLKITLKYIAP